MYPNKLETKNLILAKIKESDLQSLYNNFWSQKETARYMLWTPCSSLDEAKERMKKTIEYQKDHFAFCVYEKESGEAIGLVGMIQIEEGIYEDGGIGIGPKYVKKGYGKQILNTLIDYLFNELHVKKVICSCDSQNIASIKLLLSCSLKYTHSEPRFRKRENKEFICNFYEIVNKKV